MAGKPKPSALEVFEESIGDAQRLVDLCGALTNSRQRRMRRELREAFGAAMKMPQRSWENLDCVESNQAFVLLKPGGNSRREHFTEVELRPLLRQAIVATAAAVESYVAEKACSFVADALRAEEPPRRLLDIPVTLEDVLWVENKYERRSWGHRTLVEGYLRAEASADPSKIGQVFATVGRRGIWRQVDQHRRLPSGASEKQLHQLAERRNLIAHTGDRVGRGKASLDSAEVQNHLSTAKAVVEALDHVL